LEHHERKGHTVPSRPHQITSTTCLPASAGSELPLHGYNAPAITGTPRPWRHVRPKLGRRALGLGCAAVAVGAVLPAQAVQAAPTPASAPVVNTSANWSFTTVDNPADLTFNQLLGINDFGVIAGYYGSGSPAATHPNKGYRLMPYTNMAYVTENYPASQQTQVTAINDWGNTVGFYANTAGANYGFIDEDGVLTSVSNPETTSSPAVNQLLGLNNNGIAVGFYNDSKGNAHAYEWNRKTGHFTAIDPFGSSSATATTINDHATVAGFYAEANGNTAGFIMNGKTWQTVEFPGSTNTQIFGINNSGTVVGMYAGAHKSTHGFIYRNATYRTIDDPNGVGNTVVNGLNNQGAIVGFYTDAKGNTDGFVANVKVAGVPTA
jgi:probable HAF family extracellular repeat protein